MGGWPVDSSSVLRTQDSAQVRAATVQVQGRKRILVGKIVVCDYIGSLRRHFFVFTSNAVSQRRRSAQALLTLASPWCSAHVA
jgi:hypothetical protein